MPHNHPSSQPCSYRCPANYRPASSPSPPPPPLPPTSSRSLFFDETILLLITSLQEIMQVFSRLRTVFEEETKGVRWYASEAVLDHLWEARIEVTGGRGVGLGLGTGRGGDELRRARIRLEKVLEVAAQGTKAIVSVRRRGCGMARDRASIERTVGKMRSAGIKCLDLLVESRKKFSVFGELINELGYLKMMADEWTDFERYRSVGDEWIDRFDLY